MSSDAALPVFGSGSDELPPPTIRPVGAQPYAPLPQPATQPATQLMPSGTPYPVAEGVPPNWSTPAPATQPTYTQPTYTQPRYAQPVYRAAPTPPPPPSTMGTPTRYYAPTTAATAVPLTQRQWTGCGLPCKDGVSSWHLRGVGGWPYFEGDDAPDPCSYWGVDFGRTHCGCWGWDVYYRMAGCQYENVTRTGAGGTEVLEDGGYQHHFGVKLTYELGLGSSKWYLWVGAGGGWYFSDDYIENSDGWEVYGELGLGYVVSENLRLRAGFNVHGFDDETSRAREVDAGKARFLWMIAPVVELEIVF